MFKVSGKQISFLINMGANFSVLPSFSGPLFHSTISVMGIDGKSTCPLATGPLPCLLDNSPITHSFLIMPLCPDTFFTIPLDPDSYHLFTFTWEDPDEQVSRQLTWTVLPQGFRDSPHLFGQALARDFQQCSLELSTLLQYVDDLLLYSPSLDISRRQTAGLLNFLGDKGYHVSPAKVQLSAPTVTYLGICLTPNSRGLAAFPKLRDALLASPPLSLPDISKPLQLFTDEKQGIAMGVLTQPLGPAFAPIAYLSRQLDPTVWGWQPCLWALAAASALTKEAQKICLQQPLQATGSSVTPILISPCPLSHAGTPSPFLDSPDISLTQSPALNPATSFLLPPPNLHSFPEVVEALTQPWAGLSDLPLSNPDLTLFVDGSSCLDPQGRRKASYAVVTLERTLEAAQFPEGTTFQKAELIALTRALHLSKGRRVNIYTDSKYSFLIAHCHAVIWRERGFLSTKGSPIINARLITRLLDALQLPSQPSCTAEAIRLTPRWLRGETPEQTRIQKKKINSYNEEALLGWTFINNKIALPKAQVGAIVQQVHRSLHIGLLVLWRFLEPLFTSSTLREAVTSAFSSCSTCAAVSPQGGMRPNFPTHQMREHLSGQDWQVDFTHMPAHKKTKYLLTMVDTLTGWVEAFPTRKETAEVVAETLITHIIPRFDLPTSIQSDNGPAFISRVVQQVSTSLGISWKLHIPYHPQSSGKVERVNGLLKDHLTKLSLEIRSSWPDLLPMALTRIRATPRSPTFLSPFELLYGRPFLLNHRFPTDPPLLATYLPYLSLLRQLLQEHTDRFLPRPEPADQGSRGPAL
ncbi:LOW QUALITY PROTEIN: hypothetical protein QTO34_000349 [Cnephaeus nilssonii]|uniref:Uncharacterized protein n=1 Tax=Cnephaeus nilssonii TaxID=3371016 RepID=A0AA40IBE0_CNENI|nr:LOW QUALITY PROTEIN: hypothetical protein QTO34_000349 [Eptesicus nilssonii]